MPNEAERTTAIATAASVCARLGASGAVICPSGVRTPCRKGARRRLTGFSGRGPSHAVLPRAHPRGTCSLLVTSPDLAAGAAFRLR